MVASVLLQPGKTDAGALFTSNVSSAAFGPRGTATILAKITIVAASVFMVAAFLISLPALQGGVSVLQSVAEEPAAPVTDESPAAVESETNTNSATGTEQTQPANAAPANADAEAKGEEAPAANK